MNLDNLSEEETYFLGLWRACGCFTIHNSKACLEIDFEYSLYDWVKQYATRNIKDWEIIRSENRHYNLQIPFYKLRIEDETHYWFRTFRELKEKTEKLDNKREYLQGYFDGKGFVFNNGLKSILYITSRVPTILNLYKNIAEDLEIKNIQIVPNELKKWNLKKGLAVEIFDSSAIYPEFNFKIIGTRNIEKFLAYLFKNSLHYSNQVKNVLFTEQVCNQAIEKYNLNEENIRLLRKI